MCGECGVLFDKPDSLSAHSLAAHSDGQVLIGEHVAANDGLVVAQFLDYLLCRCFMFLCLLYLILASSSSLSR